MKTVLITGSNKGIGFEIARQLAKKDFHVIITGRNENRLTEALDTLKRENASTEMLVMDVSDAGSISRAARVLSERKMQVDVLINNAGILKREDRLLHTEAFGIIEDTINTNAYGVLKTARAFLPLMRTGGRIINISSGGGSMTDPVGGWSPAYCISKSLLNAITRHLAHELYDKKISVNAVCPGWVQTDMGGSGANRSVEKGAETPVWLASEAPHDVTGMFFRDKKQIPW